MAYKYRLIPLAQEEYESSVSWYLKRSLAAAANFVNAIDKALGLICDDPRRYRNEYKNYYECNIHKYPFTIVYHRRKLAKGYNNCYLSPEAATGRQIPVVKSCPSAPASVSLVAR